MPFQIDSLFVRPDEKEELASESNILQLNRYLASAVPGDAPGTTKRRARCIDAMPAYGEDMLVPGAAWGA